MIVVKHLEYNVVYLGVKMYGNDWAKVAEMIPTRSLVQTRTHAQKVIT
jgi:hypothetical protein